MQIITSDINLNEIWTAPIWAESIYAPSLAILQSRTRSGRTASGASATRENALEKCLSETAEILALEQALPDYLSVIDGLAAHPSADIAKHNARLEALQRKLILSWWWGECPALQLPDVWLSSAEINTFLMLARTGATADRKTGFWHLETGLPCHCVIACSSNRMGQDFILGFGTSTTAKDATRLAAIEVMLMELNLYSVMAARGGHTVTDMARIEAKIQDYAKRVPVLLPEIQRDVSTLSKVTKETAANIRSSMPSHKMIDLTPHPMSRPVWLCQIDDMQMIDESHSDHPFMAQ